MPIATSLRTPWPPGQVPLPEYPRPALVRPEWLNLNGTWEFAIRPSDGPIDSTPPPGVDGSVLVPFAVETVLSGVTRGLSPDETLYYRRRVSLPSSWAGRRVALNFEAVDHECAVFVNDTLVGTHRGGYLPFSVDLPTGVAEADVVVAVRDPGPEGGQQRGKQATTPGGIWYTATSGIWGTVWLEPLPDNAITRVVAVATADLDALDVTVDAERPGTAVVRVRLAEGGSTSATGRTGEPLRLAIPDARPWSPDDPHLYPMTVTIDGDQVSTYAALRTVCIAGQRILLNGRPALLNAPLDQGYWPESGMTPPADQALIFDLEAMRHLGFNGVRKHIKVESRRFYHHADRLGMLVVQDAVSGGKPRTGLKASAAVQALDVHLRDTSDGAHRAARREDSTNRAEFEAELTGMIELLAPHPSVVMWVPFNEAWGQFDARRIEALVRRHDPTRLVDAVSGWFDQRGGDFRSRHRYVLKLRRPPRRDRRPFYLSEFGGYNLAVPGHMWEGRGSLATSSSTTQLRSAMPSRTCGEPN